MFFLNCCICDDDSHDLGVDGNKFNRSNIHIATPGSKIHIYIYNPENNGKLNLLCIFVVIYIHCLFPVVDCLMFSPRANPGDVGLI